MLTEICLIASCVGVASCQPVVEFYCRIVTRYRFPFCHYHRNSGRSSSGEGRRKRSGHVVLRVPTIWETWKGGQGRTRHSTRDKYKTAGFGASKSFPTMSGPSASTKGLLNRS
jgi:hypothetical protein